MTALMDKVIQNGVRAFMLRNVNVFNMILITILIQDML